MGCRAPDVGGYTGAAPRTTSCPMSSSRTTGGGRRRTPRPTASWSATRALRPWRTPSRAGSSCGARTGRPTPRISTRSSRASSRQRRTT
eukprot:3737783-Alexandrium_andersonii.AAC.1